MGDPDLCDDVAEQLVLGDTGSRIKVSGGKGWGWGSKGRGAKEGGGVVGLGKQVMEGVGRGQRVGLREVDRWGKGEVMGEGRLGFREGGAPGLCVGGGVGKGVCFFFFFFRDERDAV